MSKALGLVETKGLVAAIEAADAMLKAANVKFAGKDVTKAALITIKVIGDTAAVKAAVDAGAEAASRVGQLVSTHVIPQPDDQLLSMLPEIGDQDLSKVKKSNEPELIVRDEFKEERPAKKEESSKPKVFAKKADPVVKTEKKIEKEIEPEERAEPEKEDGEVVSDTIARLRKEALAREIEENIETEKTEKIEAQPEPGLEDIENLNVHELRRLARSTPNFPIKGREISRANRDELLNHFRNLK